MGGRDLVLTDADFNRICQLIYERAGIVLADNKREMVYSRLAKRLRLHGISHFGDYPDRSGDHWGRHSGGVCRARCHGARGHG